MSGGLTPCRQLRPSSRREHVRHNISIQLSHTITAKNEDGGIELTMPENLKGMFEAMCDLNGHAEYVVQMSGQLFLKVKLLYGQTKAEGHFSDGQVWPITHNYVSSSGESLSRE